jgi:uncharacterized OsmC-like protein
MDLLTVRQVAGKKFAIEVRSHRVESDMSREDGGEDGAMSPAELVAGALAACIGMTVWTYCRNHDLPSEGIEVNAVPAMAADPRRIGNVAVDISLPAGFPANRRDAVVRVAKQCTIHNTLAHPPVVDIDIVP